MKRLIYLVCFFLLSSQLFGQLENTVYYKNVSIEVGLNTTSLLKNFISIGNVPREDVIKSITYKRISNSRNGFRSAFGAASREEFGPTFFFLSMGYERRMKAFKGFSPYWGFDIYAHASDRQNRPTSSIGRGFGFGPIFGLNYNVNDRLSLGTESAMYVNIDIVSAQFTFIPPLDLFLNVKFNKKVVKKRNIKYF